MHLINIHQRCSWVGQNKDQKEISNSWPFSIPCHGNYAQCTKILFHILDYTELFAENAIENTRFLAVDGSMDYLSLSLRYSCHDLHSYTENNTTSSDYNLSFGV